MAYDAINSYEQGSKGGVYTVQAGDTLAGIAAALWGDASLWYKLAEVNGLTAESALIEGQPLLIPVGVVRNTNNASTFQPYDPLEVLGDTAPTTPVTPKPKKAKCGVFGQILLVVIAIVVTIWATWAADKAWGAVISSYGAAAVGGAAGSIVSQTVGVATGIQDKFSWNAVAMAGITAGVTKGVDAFALNPVVSAVTANAISQGIGVATGLQKEFSWAGVAAAGVMAGVGQALGADKLAPLYGEGANPSLGNWAAHTGIGMARAIAGAATRSLIDGTDFGDNIMASLPDVIGQTIGSAIAGEIADGGFGRGIGRAFAAIGDTLGFDGQIGYEGPAGRAERRLTAALDALEPQGDGADFPTTREVLEIRREVDRARGNETALQRILGVVLGRGARFSGLGLATMLTGDSGPPPIESIVLREDRGIRIRRLAESGSENLFVDSWGDNAWQPVGVAAEVSQGVFVIDDAGAIADYIGRDLLNTIVAPGKMGDSRVQVGFGVETRNQDELDIVNNGVASKSSMEEIHNQIQDYRWRTSGVANGGRPPGDIFVVGNHGSWGPRPGYNSHHGVLDVWMRENFPDSYNSNLAPSVLMPVGNHRATFGVLNRWRAQWERQTGGPVRWTEVPESDMRALSRQMFEVARVPEPTQNLYWQRYDAMRRRLDE